jgi:hypothetical protein
VKEIQMDKRSDSMILDVAQLQEQMFFVKMQKSDIFLRLLAAQLSQTTSQVLNIPDPMKKVYLGKYTYIYIHTYTHTYIYIYRVTIKSLCTCKKCGEPVPVLC